MGGGVIAVLGGSFDPPHLSHLAIVRAVLGRRVATSVLLVPCVRHALGKSMEAFDHRIAMCRLVCDEAGPGAEASDIERRLGLSGFTIDTLEAIAGQAPDRPVRLIVGADILEERHLWRRFDDIQALFPPILVAREGWSHGGMEALPAPPGVSSTRVRSLLAAGTSPSDLVPATVLRYIERNALYGWHQP